MPNFILFFFLCHVVNSACSCGMDVRSNVDLIQTLGVPHNHRAIDWTRDYVLHQNPMHSPQGMSNIREQINAAAKGERKKLPLYGWREVEPEL